jgi:tRNA threonylcarbamoyladenosine biosynthesis protein TsaB
LRVGLAAAKGLALPTGVPLYVVSSLEALALDILTASSGEATGIAVPCLDAGKGEVYVGGYAGDPERLVREAVPPVRLAAPALAGWLAEIASPVVAGNGATRFPNALGGARLVDVRGPTAVSVGRLALLACARGEAADLASAVPFYGRPPDITTKRRS